MQHFAEYTFYTPLVWTFKRCIWRLDVRKPHERAKGARPRRARIVRIHG